MRHALAALVVAGLLAACAPTSSTVLIGTTTTIQDTGLTDALIPDFQRRSGHLAKLVVAGSGQILETAARGDLDVVLTHSPADEEAFVRSGNGRDRRLVMHNDFILVGPAADPARIRGQDASQALATIFAAGAPFISRGDRSGTHVKELALWREARLDPKGRPWYVESSAGQLQTLQLAAQRRAYALVDRGTWLANRGTVDLELLVSGGRALLNVYHVTLVNQERFPKVNAAGALAFADYLVSLDGQRLIAEFGRDRFGEPLFVADAGKDQAELP
jgi:tungstate transport system substrate-binding protein